MAILLCPGLAAAQHADHLSARRGNPDQSEDVQVEIVDGLVSVQAQDVSLQRVIEQLAAKEGIIVVLAGPLDERITVRLHRAPMARAIRAILRNQSFVLHQDVARAGEASVRSDLPTRLWIFSDGSENQAPDFGVARAVTYGNEGRSTQPGRDRKARIAKVYELSEIGDINATGALVAMLNDPDTEVRKEVALALGETRTGPALQALEGVLGDADAGVRGAAIDVFSDIGGNDSARALAIALSDDEKRLRMNAVDALGEIGGDIARRLLEQALSDPDRGVRETAEELLAELAEPPKQRPQATTSTVR
jgi:hypothetical protein